LEAALIRLIALAVWATAFLHVGEVCAQAVLTLRPDLAFHFYCKGDAQPPSEIAIEDFLSSHGFRVLNKVALARKHHVKVPYTMNIVALDKGKRMIEFTTFPVPDPNVIVFTNVYFVTLNSPPPTRHDAELEEALIAFTHERLGCESRHIRHGDNGEDAHDLYEQIFKVHAGWFQEAEELEHPPT
jgi:hypothetical protein